MLRFTHICFVVNFAVKILQDRKGLMSYEGIRIKYYECASVFLSLLSGMQFYMVRYIFSNGLLDCTILFYLGHLFVMKVHRRVITDILIFFACWIVEG